MPTEYVLSFKLECGIGGLWAGYGASAILLSVLYFCILTCINWQETAKWATENEEFSQSSESSESSLLEDKVVISDD